MNSKLLAFNKYTNIPSDKMVSTCVTLVTIVNNNVQFNIISWASRMWSLNTLNTLDPLLTFSRLVEIKLIRLRRGKTVKESDS